VTHATGAPCVVSVAEHAGWAHLVCVATAGEVPAVIERRRVAMIDEGLPTQPYHHESIGMPEDKANALIARVRRSISAHASLALQQAATDLAPEYAVVALAIREPPFPELPDTIAAVWSSYRFQCAADGMLYQLAMCGAARDLGFRVHLYRRGEEVARAAERLETTSENIDSFVSRTGRPSGPPWTQEHRRAFAAGIAALAAHTHRRIRVPAYSLGSKWTRP
jgi:hypothetical protein